MVEGEEKARQSFARELHDGLGPLLASVKMSVSVIGTYRSTRFSRR
jgi:signal transduction histidine kinase